MIRVENIRQMEKARNVKRFLIDRDWPSDVVRSIPHNEKSGQSRPGLAQIGWLPQLAPSRALWKWFHHDLDKGGLFRSRYFRELEKNKKYWAPIAQESEKSTVSLLYHGRDASQVPAYFLKEFLDAQLKANQVPKSARKKFMSSPGQGVAAPVEKAISRKRSRSLKDEKPLAEKQRLTYVSAGKRRVLR